MNALLTGMATKLLLKRQVTFEDLLSRGWHVYSLALIMGAVCFYSWMRSRHPVKK